VTTCGTFTGIAVELWTSSAPGVEVYADDVVVAPGPVGCN